MYGFMQMNNDAFFDIWRVYGMRYSKSVSDIFIIIFAGNHSKMFEKPRPQSLEHLNPVTQPKQLATNPPKLIQFDSQTEQISEFKSEYSSQVYDQQASIISTQTEKRKKQMRQKVNEYLNNRKSLGIAMKRTTYVGEQQEYDGDILDELDNIGGVEKKHGEAEQFILAFNKNPDNAINEYIKKGIISSDDPDVIAAYLTKMDGLDKQVLGRYFGQNNQTVLKILHSYCKLLNFRKIQFDRALRTLLSKFRLPGESQQIQRIVWEFSLAFYQVNQQDYDNADQLFPLAYAIIMLGTDAHNPKQQKKMTKQDFIKNTRFACPSITAEYLGNVYERITTQKFQTQFSDIQNMYMRLRDINMSDFQSTLKLTKQLKKGDVFLKVCRNTPKFVQRKLYLSDDEQRIEWVSDPIKSQSQEPRFIQIKDITDLTLGLNSAVMKKNKVPQQFDPMCFTIQTLYRTLDLKAKTNKERAKWLNFLRAVLIRRRQKKIQDLQQHHKNASQREHIQQIWNTQIFPHWDSHWDYKNKKPLVRNVIVRGIEAICCCWKKRPKTSDGLQNQGEFRGIKIKNTKLQTLWRLGLPANSRKVLWPLVIGNNLALNTIMIQQIKKRCRKDEQLRKFVGFNIQVIQMGQICRQLRPDIPPIRQLLLISQLFLKAIPKSSGNNTPTNNSTNSCLTAFLNLIHLDHFLAFYRGDKNQIDLRMQLFQSLLQKNALKVKKHFQVLKLETRMYLVSWFLSGFMDCFGDNEQFLFRIWDNFLLEGENYLFKVGITIVKYYEVELKMCTFHEGLKILRFPKSISTLLFFQILQNEIDVKDQYFVNYIDIRKHAIIKTKVQAIPLQ